MGSKEDKKDYSILTHRGFKYKFSLDEILSLNDYYIDFRLYLGGCTNAVQKCDSINLRNYINNSYKITLPINRLSAKIVATNDPTLNKEGIPTL
jgi:hypothetical protein